MLAQYFTIQRSRIYRFRRSVIVDKDQKIYETIKAVFDAKKQKVGERQIKMILSREVGLTISRKKIARIKKKYGLVTRIRRKRFRLFPFRSHEHRIAPNLLARNFQADRPDQVYLTDITELPYGSGKRAYLVAFKDLATREIVAREISKSIDVRFVNSALKKAVLRLPKDKRQSLIIHSDQGTHFTSGTYRRLLRQNGVTQSMSRRGNCLDNAPMESFFGHFKDHLEHEKTFEDLARSVTKEIEYYNYQRPQWDLKRMPPKAFRRHLNRTARFFKLS